jgi:hypothetical protein
MKKRKACKNVNLKIKKRKTIYTHDHSRCFGGTKQPQEEEILVGAHKQQVVGWVGDCEEDGGRGFFQKDQ